MLTSEKPTSNTTLLDSTTFVVHTKKKVSILRGEAILTQEGRNLLKLRIDQCITMIIFVKKHNLFKQYMSSGELFVEFFF